VGGAIPLGMEASKEAYLQVARGRELTGNIARAGILAFNLPYGG